MKGKRKEEKKKKEKNFVHSPSFTGSHSYPFGHIAGPEYPFPPHCPYTGASRSDADETAAALTKNSREPATAKSSGRNLLLICTIFNLL